MVVAVVVVVEMVVVLRYYGMVMEVKCVDGVDTRAGSVVLLVLGVVVV